MLREAAAPQRAPTTAPDIGSNFDPPHSRIASLKAVFRAMLVAREVDRIEQQLVQQGQAFFHVSGAGHEASAALASHLRSSDWLHLHYRDKALLHARGLPVAEFFRSLLARSGSHSAGRQMSAHFSAPDLNILSLVGPVGNNALQTVGVASAIKDEATRPIVVCSIGDGSTQQGEFLEAVAEAVRSRLPVLFLVEDNRYSISTPTSGKTFFDLPDSLPNSFYGLPIQRVDGSDAVEAGLRFSEIVSVIRETRGPQLVVMHVERLGDHTNADDQTQYRDASELARGLASDPIPKLRQFLLAHGTPAVELDHLARTVQDEVRAAADQVHFEPDPQPAFTAKAPLPPEFVAREEFRGASSGPRLTMREAINSVLRHRLESDSRVFLYGQDIEDPKGDVFGVTRGLSTRFPSRVVNAPLSESTIVGACIGRALAGQRPVAFLQFADFLPLAYNQILSELGSMFWRSNGGWQSPVIVMLTCGGYKPGLGPFHAQTLESLAAHTPGVDVVMPSTAADAAGLLNAAFESSRPTLFFYPKSCLNLPQRSTSGDVAGQFVPPGKALRLAAGHDLTLVTWGNTLTQCEQAASALADADYSVELYDLRSLSPWDETAIVASAEKTGRLVVVHEDNQTCGFGAEVVATVAERSVRPVQMRRVVRSDTYVPYHFGNQLDVLPSFRRVMEACADLLGCDLTWPVLEEECLGHEVIRVLGSGPADDTVEVVEVRVDVGDEIEPGQIVAEVEATKSAVEIRSTTSGRVVEVCAAAGERLLIGAPLIRLEATALRDAPVLVELTREPPRPPVISRRADSRRSPRLRNRRASLPEDRIDLPAAPRASTVGIAGIAGIAGGRTVANAELVRNWPNRTASEVLRQTGIESRRWIASGETVLSLAVDATRQLFAQTRASIHDVDLVIGCTTTPDRVTPSLACRVANVLASRDEQPVLAAYDLNAACSGYLYALAQAYDFLQQQPASRVLIVTSEVLSPLLDMEDYGTASLFGDAATATLVVGQSHSAGALLRCSRPFVSGRPDDQSALQVPLSGGGTILMRGEPVFREAVMGMFRSLRTACEPAGLDLADLESIVPHQANQRIIDALARRTGCSVHSIIRDLGNTASSSIPMALSRLQPSPGGAVYGLTAFGGGYTFGAAIVRAEGSTSSATHRPECQCNGSAPLRGDPPDL